MQQRRSVVSVVVAVAAACLLFVGFCVAAGGALADDADLPSSVPTTGGAPIAPGRPCANPVETQGFGPTVYAFEPPLRGAAHFHTGIDFVCLGDRTIHALVPGVVFTVVRSDCGGGFGCNVVVASQVNGRTLFSRYAHGAQGSQLVVPGELVAAGQPLELEGSTGNSTGAHVHVEVDEGTPFISSCIDPAPFLDPATVRD